MYLVGVGALCSRLNEVVKCHRARELANTLNLIARIALVMPQYIRDTNFELKFD